MRHDGVRMVLHVLAKFIPSVCGPGFAQLNRGAHSRKQCLKVHVHFLLIQKLLPALLTELTGEEGCG